MSFDNAQVPDDSFDFDFQPYDDEYLTDATSPPVDFDFEYQPKTDGHLTDAEFPPLNFNLLFQEDLNADNGGQQIAIRDPFGAADYISTPIPVIEQAPEVDVDAALIGFGVNVWTQTSDLGSITRRECAPRSYVQSSWVPAMLTRLFTALLTLVGEGLVV